MNRSPPPEREFRRLQSGSRVHFADASADALRAAPDLFSRQTVAYFLRYSGFSSMAMKRSATCRISSSLKGATLHFSLRPLGMENRMRSTLATFTKQRSP